MKHMGMVLAVAMLGSGCGVSQLSVPATALEARIKFTAESGVLKLEQRSYPNPDALHWLEARVRSNGEIQVSCQADSSLERCTDSPIVTKIDMNQSAPTLQVFDVFGELLAEIPFTGCLPEDEGGKGGSNNASDGGLGTVTFNLEQAPIQAPNCELLADGGSPFGADGGFIDEGWFGSDDGGFPFDNGGSSTDDGGFWSGIDQGDCAAVREQAQARFCQEVNARLEELSLGYEYDCTHLDQPVEMEESDVEMNQEVGCRRDVVGPARDEVADEVEQAQGMACRMVQIDLLNWANEAYEELRDQGVCGMSPLVLDLDGNGIELTPMSGGVQFDLLASGTPVRTAWVSSGDALLVLDRNQNGQVDDASELFGNRSGGARFADGFAALAELDANGDRAIDAKDPVFSNLHVWSDRNHDGVGPRDEWRTLAQAGIASLQLDAREISGRDAWDGRGNRIPLRARFTRTDGNQGELVDAFFRYEPRAAPVLACYTPGN
ncbi:MAG: hypothetical protein WBV82_24325 [Myxococcaceae bacterium]